MTNYTYKRNIPASQNNPSNDQGPMRTNTNSIDSLIAEDHYSFGVTNGGLHKQVRLVDLLSVPSGIAAGMGTLYTKLATSTTPSNESNLFFVPDTGDPVPGPTRQYQLTRTITAEYSKFGTNLTYGSPSNTNRKGGWTFLPGGLLLQYGTFKHTSATTTIIAFPIAFTQVYSITTGGQIDNGGEAERGDIGIRALSGTQFVAKTTSSAELTFINWMAIGI